MLNPYTHITEGDLSRADVVVLTLLARGKDVVEFGVGGSTVLLGQVAEHVTTYDTDGDWIARIKPKVGSNVDFQLIENDVKVVDGLGRPCDVLFDDGHSNLRAAFLMEFWPFIRDCAILHDGRMSYPGNCLKKFLDAWTIPNEASRTNPGLPDNPYTGSLRKIEWNYLESNMVVFYKRNCMLRYENWKVTER